MRAFAFVSMLACAYLSKEGDEGGTAGRREEGGWGRRTGEVFGDLAIRLVQHHDDQRVDDHWHLCARVALAYTITY